MVIKMKIRKIISLILCLAVLVCSVPAIYASADSGWTLAQMKASFPHGKYWNHKAQPGHGYNANAGWQHYGSNCGDILFSVTDHPCYSHNANAPVGQYDCNTYYNQATQCAGFARLMADLAYPGSTNVLGWSKVTNKNTAVSVVKPGDVIHYKGGGADATWGHWVFVTGVSGSVVTLGECNVGDKCNIYWGRTFNLYNAASLTLYSAPYQWNPGAAEYTLDVNAKLDGADKGVLDGIATFDVYINGSLVANDVTDYCKNHAKGTAYEIKDVKTTACYVLTGVQSFSGTLNSNADCRFVFETKHTLNDGVITTQPTCTEKGVKTVSCLNCDYKTTSEVDSLGHDYKETRIDPTCTENAKYVSICSRCNDSAVRPVTDEDIWSEWSEVKPDVDESRIQTKTQYRYMQSETKLSPEAELAGWTLVGKAWGEGKTETVSYVESFPSGFAGDHSLYYKYNKFKPVAYENDTTKVEVGSAKTTGYIYWHWCSSKYNGNSPINRLINDRYSSWDNSSNRPYDVFHAFYTTEYRGVTASAGAVNFSNSSACNQTYWWQPAIPVVSVPVTTYEMMYEYTRETEWGEWTDNAFSVTDDAKFETRTLYRYSDSKDLATGHAWDNGVVDETKDLIVYSCKKCDETKSEKYEKPDFVVGDVNEDGKVTAMDARLALRYSAKIGTLTDTQLLAADVNKDGKVNASDARKILRVGAKIDIF